MSFTSACVFGPEKEEGLGENFQARAPEGPCVMLSKTLAGKCALPRPPGLHGNWFGVKNGVSVNPVKGEMRGLYLSSINK